jgi:TetR/AcrR family transcriptional repressor of nem operon
MGRISDARQRLINAVCDLVWENGYNAVTIDAICERAGVKKGSFYYFFDSKADLAAHAIAALWESQKREIDKIFSREVPPLERLTSYFEAIYRKQRDKKEQFGRVLGCPYFTLGAEGSLDEKILCEVQKVLTSYVQYFESAIRDAQAAGQIVNGEAKTSARCVFSLYEGTITRARIQNDLDLLYDLPGYVLQLLGASSAA